MMAGEAQKVGLFQPVTAGLLAAIVGFGSSFPIVLQGLAAAGASPAEAASGLIALSIVMGLLAIFLSLRTRMPVSVAWSTPGAALLVATGTPEGGFSGAVGAFLVAAALIVVAGVWKGFGRAVAAIPSSLANAMLAGVLLDLCLAPVRAVGAMPALALPIILVWAIAWRFARLYAVPIAVVVTAAIVLGATPVPPGALDNILPHPVLVLPTLSMDALIGISLPLFLVTMASQNVPGLAVMHANGYRPDVSPIFVSSGLASMVTSLFGGHLVNLAAITAALCAGPEAHPNPNRRYIAAVTNGVGYLLLGLFAGFAAAFIAASPPLLIQAVAGLALLGALTSALSGALAKESERIPAIMTFVTTASGISFFGIGAAFWGLLVGGLMLSLARSGRR
ncbi:MAG TPA: benzoate/H(+) symporter BenE family transporter [Geminicoccus sp.]|jgi:benzoate membrane transport protein|uniref:benzoate/H(+) symporter BenE family transporter n=1 Tax=Geminicoccus sp. TaxID=2024832 RepID=UPI002E315735|nr:benzoate/H(+) symporter BenE family transporter [Geminicoccus sp.]HEX2527164.1 benzoate/H(+) symporter BenE family transporter [Geminicoccus sp.]